MAELDDLFHRHNPSTNKRKLDISHDPSKFYKSARTSVNGDAKGGTHATVEDETQDDDDLEAGPTLPPDDADNDPSEDDDEDGRFFGGGVDANTSAAMDYIDQRDAENKQEVEDKFDVPWLRKTALSFEKRISKNAEMRAKYENDPSKFMASEADLDDDVKALSILSEHPDLYAEFAKLGCVASLVSLLAHENTDIAIDAIQILSELLDEDVNAQQVEWESLVHAALDADLLSLLISNFGRFDEGSDADREGLYNSLNILENLASQPPLATRIGEESSIFQWLVQRLQRGEAPVSQNTQYSAELLAILLQSSPSNRNLILSGRPHKNGDKRDGHSEGEALNAVDTLLTLMSPYRRSDPPKDSVEEEYVANLFDALTVLLDNVKAKELFVAAEGVELLLIMLREGKTAKPRALRNLDHACSGVAGGIACEQVVEAQGLKALFSLLMKSGKKGKEELGRESYEHLLSIFASLLRNLSVDSAPRIRTLAKFMEKDYEKIDRLLNIRYEYRPRVLAVSQQITKETRGLGTEERAEREFDGIGRRLDAGLYILQTIDLILAWLIAEDGGAKKHIMSTLEEHDETLSDVQRTLQEQLDGIEEDDEADEGVTSTKEMLTALVSFLN